MCVQLFTLMYKEVPCGFRVRVSDNTLVYIGTLQASVDGSFLPRSCTTQLRQQKNSGHVVTHVLAEEKKEVVLDPGLGVPPGSQVLSHLPKIRSEVN